MRKRIFLILALLVVFTVSATASFNYTTIDNFEDGDKSEYTGGDNTGLTVQSNTVIEGSYTGDITTEGGDNEAFWNPNQNISQGDSFSYITRLETEGRFNGGFALVQDANDRYTLRFQEDSDYIALSKFVSGSYTKVKEKSIDWDNDVNYRWEVNWTTSDTFNMDLYYHNNDSKVLSFSVTDSSFTWGYAGFLESAGAATTGETVYWDGKTQNSPPSFNLTSISPDPPLMGENVSYSAEVYDSDGSIQYTNLTLEFDGSTVVSDAKRTGITPEWNDIYKPGSTGWLNATFETVDNDGAVTSKHLNRYLEDNPPNIDILKPGNKTYWNYNSSFKFDTSDSDSDPGETFSCDIFQDATLEDQASVQEGGNYSGSFLSDLGSRNITVECTDGSGNTGKKAQYFSIDDFSLTSTFADSTTYETFNETFESDFYLGDMVNNVTVYFYWNGIQRSEKVVDASGQGSYFSDHEFTIPLQDKNGTSRNWSFDFDVNRDDISSGTETQMYQSSKKSQTVYWSYWIQASAPIPDSKIIEGQSARHQVNISRKTSSANLTGVLNFTRNTDTVSMKQVSSSPDKVVFEAEDYSGNVTGGQNSQTDRLNSTITIEFQDKKRTVEASDQISTYDIRFDDCSSLTTEALQFKVYQETNRTNLLKSSMALDVSVWRNERYKEDFSFGTDRKTQNYCIAPSWATYRISSTDKLIQYQDVDEQYRLRSYFLFGEKISKSEKKVELYTIPDSDSSRIQFKTVNSEGESLANTIIVIDRYFPSEGKSLTVAMTKTGSNGETETFLQTNEIYYSYKFYRPNKNGTYVLVDSEPKQIISDNTIRFTIGESETVTLNEYRKGINYNCEYNATRVDCSWSSTRNFQEFRLQVQVDKPVGMNTACDKSTSSDSGELICTGLNASKNGWLYSFSATTADGIQIPLESGGPGKGDLEFGKPGLMISFFFFLSLGFAGIAGNRPIPEISIALSTLSIVASYAMGMMGITYQAAASFVIVAAVSIYKMRNQFGGGGL